MLFLRHSFIFSIDIGSSLWAKLLYLTIRKYYDIKAELLETHLIEQLREGNHQAFKLIFERYYSLMCAIAYEYVEDTYICQNIAEDVMLSIWEKREQLHISVSIKSYLLTSVRNRSIDYLRGKSRKMDSVSYDDIPGISECFIPDEEIFEKIVLLELEDKISEIVDKMSPESRNVFILSRYEEKSYVEIAEELHISVNTVKYHIKQALALLREGLKDYLIVIVISYFYLFHP